MPDGCENSTNTDGFSEGLPMRGTVVFVIAAGWPTIFTTYMGGVGRLGTGGSITAACDVFAEDVTRLGTKSDDEAYDRYCTRDERTEDD